MLETQVQSLGREDPMEKETATLSSILAWEIPWTEEPGGLQSVGLQELDTTEWINDNNPHSLTLKFSSSPRIPGPFSSHILSEVSSGLHLSLGDIAAPGPSPTALGPLTPGSPTASVSRFRDFLPHLTAACDVVHTPSLQAAFSLCSSFSLFFFWWFC